MEKNENRETAEYTRLADTVALQAEDIASGRTTVPQLLRNMQILVSWTVQ